MKKITFLLLTTFFAFNPVFSQVVYSDDFENYILGNLGTMPDGQTPGQGGWLTEVGRSPMGAPSITDNPLFAITNEPSRGKVLTLSGSLPNGNETVIAKNINLAPLIDNRNINNNVLKFEIDYYTGSQHSYHNNLSSTRNFITISKNNSILPQNVIVSFAFNPKDGMLQVPYNRGEKLSRGEAQLNGLNTIFPFNTWMKFIVYLDYANKEIYFETPYFGKVIKKSFLESSTSTNLLQDFKPAMLYLSISTYFVSSTYQMINKYDNIKITALKEVPPHIVSANSFLSEKFTIFPNPASNFVNITNTLNLGVEEVSIYDLSGKLLKTQKVVSTENVQLNIEELAAGMYMFHIKTKEGTAVKKIIKK